MSRARVNTLSLEDAAYIAGLVDGEGTVTLTKLHAHENRRLVVSIANTELPLLEFVIERVGCGKITRKRATSSRHTPSYCYSIASRQALALLRQLTPYLRSYKSKRADMALEHYTRLTPRNGRYSPVQLRDRRRVENSLLAVRGRAPLTR